MRTATAAIPSLDRPAHMIGRPFALRLAGVAVACFLPAAFWTFAIELIALWSGDGLSSMTLGVIGGAIAIFLFAVCAPLMLRSHEPKPGLNADQGLLD